MKQSSPILVGPTELKERREDITTLMEMVDKHEDNMDRYEFTYEHIEELQNDRTRYLNHKNELIKKK